MIAEADASGDGANAAEGGTVARPCSWIATCLKVGIDRHKRGGKVADTGSGGANIAGSAGGAETDFQAVGWPSCGLRACPEGNGIAIGKGERWRQQPVADGATGKVTKIISFEISGEIAGVGNSVVLGRKKT